MPKTHNSNNVRLDKWLWAARFFKTRSLAAAAVKGGKVRVNGGRAKASRLLNCGEQLSIRRGDFSSVITVIAIADKRLSATLAQQLYSESTESILLREKLVETKRIERKASVRYGGRPDKQGRRKLLRQKRKNTT